MPWYNREQRQELYRVAKLCAADFRKQRCSSEVYPDLYLLRCKLKVFRACSTWVIEGNRHLYPDRDIGALQKEAKAVLDIALTSIGQAGKIRSQIQLKPNQSIINFRR